MHTWMPQFVLPNLLVKEPVEVEYVALVAPSDPRCEAIAKTNKNFYPFFEFLHGRLSAQGDSERADYPCRCADLGNVDGGDRGI